MMTGKVLTTFLWFDNQAEAAAEFYTSIFPDSKTGRISRYGEVGPGPAGSVMVVEFQLCGQPFAALNGGPHYSFTPAISFQIPCEDQAEVDYYWGRLSDGGQEVACGWVTDKFGVSWQVVPAILPELTGGPDPEKARRATEAMLSMVKLDIAALQRAYDGA
jgi:predicted 3-demethylubiquinone-9 3-methyltransferase (glyoxalase superfamily)